MSGGEGCPKCAFLGLCEEGFARGVPQGNYTSSKKNKQYAVDAVTILKENPDLANDPASLWKLVIKGETIKYHQQMDVVTVLWKSNLIE